MKIYSAYHGTKQMEKKMVSRNMGVMISSRAKTYPDKGIQRLPFFALDNGAFRAWGKGYPFDEYVFLRTLSKCLELGLDLDFIVCPDIVRGGMRSLEFSLRWSDRIPCDKLALAVQEGMEEDAVESVLDRFSYVLIGGADDWAKWVKVARRNGKKCHIGKAGNLDRLRYALELGVDSVDSTNFVRHDDFSAVDALYAYREQAEFDWGNDEG